MTIYAFVPARSGSARIPDKNLQDVGGMSLVGRAANLALDLGYKLVLSTDSEDISIYVMGQVWKGDHRPFHWHRRPEHLAGPTAQIEDAITHWLRHVAPKEGPEVSEDDIIVLLQPTSPFRRPETVKRCVDLLIKHNLDSVLTVHMDTRGPFRGDRCHVVQDSETGEIAGLRAIWHRPEGWKRPRSQDVRAAPEETGGVYVTSVRSFRKTRSRMGGSQMVIPVDWFEAFEIDTPLDLEIARAVWPLWAKVTSA